MRHALVFCEGYQDRGFIGEWLERRLACPRLAGLEVPAIKVKDAHTKRTPSGRDVLVIPTHGVDRLASKLKDIAKNHAEQVDRCLIVVDADDRHVEERQRAVRQSVEGAEGLPGTFDVVCWRPRLEQHLEDALRELFPRRLAAVDAFLGTRPDPTSTSKEAAFTYCSAWRPDNFGDAFFAWVWQDEAVATKLEGRLPEVREALRRLIA